jgi:hypothetical protein
VAESGDRSRPEVSGRTVAGIGAAVALVLLVVVFYGGYGEHWRWVGVSGATATLWDWLHLLLLPIAAVVLPLWLRYRPELHGAVLAGVGALGAAFVCVVLAGYLVPWAWTGFVGNTLWDWLNLGALPLAVALIPVLIELSSEWGRRHAVALSIAAVVFIAVVVAGYLARWAWTGFVGNTVWDWMHLLLLPLLVPVVIVPVLRTVLAERLDDGAVEDADRGVKDA